LNERGICIQLALPFQHRHFDQDITESVEGKLLLCGQLLEALLKPVILVCNEEIIAGGK